MIPRISSVMEYLILLLRALLGEWPPALSASAAFFSSQPLSSTSPSLTMTLSAEPAGRSLDENDRPCLVRKSLARSQSEYLVNGVTNTWNSQSLAWTLIVVLAWYASSAGFT